MAVLSAGNRRLQGFRTMDVGITGKDLAGGGDGLLVPSRRTNGLGKGSVALVDGQGLTKVDKVSVEIDVVLGHAAKPGKPMGIDRMNGEIGCAGRQFLDEA